MTVSFFRMFIGRDGKYYFTLHSRGNAEPILRCSEGYSSKSDCLKGIASVRTHSPYDKYYDRKGVGAGNLWFTLIAANYEIIGVSETYSSKQARETGIAAVKRDAPLAELRDQTANR